MPNNHLQYAITWYGLALVLIVMTGMLIVGDRRAARREAR
jgi:surfeit locus 1 family protein